MKMKMKMVLSLMVILVTLTGCFSKGSKNADTTPLQTAPTTSSSDFKLSEREQEVYNNFQKDLNEQQLKGLEPISIAKLYVQARLDNKNDVVYALYTDKSGYVQWSKEEDKKIPSSDRGTKEQILETFGNIEKGKFVQTSDFEGYIEYQSSKEANSKSGFNMIKDDDGIWNVSFKPIQ
ncbi:RNA polymerase subunit sigma [Paenibacillus whitsoniae]|uniref:RNA polymerase subunit sigma n=1 Tax=Paenibacillus whitsoniae TaxID=2496558 RepID=UPI001F4A092E|nr:RNA polymerase subunit sigma [Paenibacillus whitsoniae]